MKRFFKLCYVLIISLFLGGFIACDDGGSGGGGDSEKVSVTGVDISSYISISESYYEHRVQVTIIPDNATNQYVTFDIADTNVATIDGTGLITPVSEGRTTITVTTVDGGYMDTANLYICNSDTFCYELTVRNRTKGNLKNVSIDTYSCGDLDADDSCSYVFTTKPASITVSKESAGSYGDAFDTDIVHDFSSDVHTAHGYLYFSLPSSHYSLWVGNFTTYSIDAIRFGWNGTDYNYDEYNLVDPITDDEEYRFIGFFLMEWNDIDLYNYAISDGWRYTDIPFQSNGYSYFQYLDAEY